MIITIDRFKQTKDATLSKLSIDGKFRCYVLEDVYHAIKIFGKTRIPCGVYDIKLRTEGGYYKKYCAKFSEPDHGILWLQNVKDYKYIYIHIGNYSDQTKGCLLTGYGYDLTGKKTMVTRSTDAYTSIYYDIREQIWQDQDVKIVITDNDFY